MELIIIVAFIAITTFTLTRILFGLKTAGLPHTVEHYNSRLKQIERQLGNNPTLPSDRRLKQIERKLDLIFHHLDIKIPEFEEDYPLTLSPEFCNVILQFAPPESKIAILKTVRTLTGLGLKEAKELIESAPQIILRQIPESEAESAKLQLEQSGARVTLQ